MYTGEKRAPGSIVFMWSITKLQLLVMSVSSLVSFLRASFRSLSMRAPPAYASQAPRIATATRLPMRPTMGWTAVPSAWPIFWTPPTTASEHSNSPIFDMHAGDLYPTVPAAQAVSSSPRASSFAPPQRSCC